MIAPLAALVFLLVVQGACAAAFPGTAAAGPVPDTVQMALLRYAVAEVRLVRIEGDFGTRWGRGPSFDSSGVRLGEGLKGHANTMRVARRAGEVESIPWEKISSIETDRATAGRDAMVGLTIGFLAGSMIAISRINFLSFENQQSKGDIIWQLSAGGLALGALIGKHGETKTIYPPSPERHH